jgi:hypothetical protein
MTNFQFIEDISQWSLQTCDATFLLSWYESLPVKYEDMKTYDDTFGLAWD